MTQINATEDEAVSDVVAQLLELTRDQRMDVFGHFCTYCGDDDPRCQCCNDE